ncbi:MAG: hypothetical protein IT353_23400 [Gemmatimonadaceae bacterium]|nr:hypothetical protein [Gemmatimonadaceae bacterium]
MLTFSGRRSLGALVFVMALSALPANASAQTGKWVATVSQIQTAGGSADITIEPRGEKLSRVKVSMRNIKRDMRLAWDIVAGQCRDQGAPIAPQATFTQVQTMMDGSGTATANVPKLESGKQYYVRIFDPQTSPTDNNVWGCANIAEKP